MSDKISSVVIIGINYYPEDSAIGLYTTQKAEYLTAHGFDVTVITGFPYYPQWKISEDYQKKSNYLTEELNGVKIYRYKQYVPAQPSFLKRIIHLLSFTFGNMVNIFKVPKPDIVITIIPFTTTALLGCLLKLRYKSKLWIHIQDFEFDAAVGSDLLKGNKKIIIKALLWIEKKILSRADIVSTISHGMMNKLKQKTSTKTYYLPNWIDENTINPKRAPQHQYLKSHKIKILYSGNIGDKQDWKAFIRFCRDLNLDRHEIIIVGDGSKKRWLIKNIQNLTNVKHYPPVPYKELSSLLCSTDIHVLFQKNDVIDSVMPSKLLGMMASAKPSIIIGNKNSEIKKVINESKGGVYFNHYSEDIVNKIEELSINNDLSKEMGKNARGYVIKHFSKEQIMKGVIIKIKELLNDS